MNALVEVIKELDETEGFPILFDIEDAIWYKDDDTIYWNTDNSESDLINEEGLTYSGYITEGYVETTNYFVANLDTQTGTWMTSAFPLEKRIPLERIEEMQNDY